MAKLGSVKLSIDSESLGTSVDITSYPVEKGSPISDHVQENPQTLNISGVVVGSDYKTKLQKLRDVMRKSSVLTYTGRTIAKNVLIQSIDDNRETKIKNGSSVSIKLQFIKIAKSPWKKAPPKRKTQQKKVSNSGKKQKTIKKKTSAVYHVIKNGDTYWSLSRKYGTSIKQLKAWNKWPDTKIPTGKKARVK